MIGLTDYNILTKSVSKDNNKFFFKKISFILNDLKNLQDNFNGEPKLTNGFQRVLQRAAIHVQSSGRESVTGANMIVALFSEKESYAVHFLHQQNMTRLDAVQYISHGISKVNESIETDEIDDETFVNALQYLIKVGIIQVTSLNQEINSCEFEHIPILNNLNKKLIFW